MAGSTAFAFALYPRPLLPSKRPRTRCIPPPRAVAASVNHAQPARLSDASVVEVVQQNGSRASARGFCIAPGALLTCFHAVAHAESIFVDGRRAHVLRSCRAADAVLLSCADGYSPESLSSDPSPPAEISLECETDGGRLPVLGLGSALYASGAILPVLQARDDDRVLGPGLSGAPVYDERSGEVAGMFAAVVAATGAYSVARAVPASLLRPLVDGTGDDVRLGALPGLCLQEMHLPLVRAAVGVPDGLRGVRVASGGDRHGLQDGDVVLALDGQECRASSELTMLLAVRPPSSVARCSVWRYGVGVVEVDVMLGDAERMHAAAGWAPGVVAVSEGGFVFMALSFEFLSQWGSEWHRMCPSELLRIAMTAPEEEDGVSNVPVVVANVPRGYEQLLYKTVGTVAGQKVRGLADMELLSRQSDAPAVAMLHGGMVVQIGKCTVQEGHLVS